MTSTDQVLASDARKWTAEVDAAVRLDLRSPHASLEHGGRTVDSRAYERRASRALPLLAAIGVALLSIGAYFAVTHHSSVSAGGKSHATRPSFQTPTPGATDNLEPRSDDFVGFTHVRALSAEQASGMLSLPWRFDRLSGNQTSLQVYFMDGSPGCVEFQGFLSYETRRSIIVQAVGKPTSVKGCANILKTSRTILKLKHPLGQRQLLHATLSPGYRNLP